MIRQDYLIFLKNKEWYYWDKNQWKYILTNKAPREAVESYKEFYKEVNKS